MAKKEIKTDLWVYELLKQSKLNFDAQGSNVAEINNALKTASKKGTGNVGFPEFVGVVKDYVIVIEDKADLTRHCKLDNDVISSDTKAITDYAVNGAIFYAKHLIKNTSYKKAFAIGVSGDSKKHRITPIYVDETEFYRELKDLESFICFMEDNIDEYYTKEVLKEDTDVEKEVSEILKDAAELHEDLRNYGNLLDTEKPLIVSGIMLALREIEFKGFSIDDLTGDTIKTDGQKIYDAINANLKRANVAPEVKKDKILSQFSFIKDTVKLNEIEPKIAKTPLKHFAEFLYSKIYKSIRYSKSAEDYITKANQVQGDTPYVSSSSLCNGVDNFIGNKTRVRKFSDCLSLANSGSVGSCFYHPYEFIASDHVTQLKNEKFSEASYLFLSVLLKRFNEKYNFNREISDERISREKILVPVKNDDSFDDNYMEKIVKLLELKLYKRYLNYKGAN